MTRIGIDAHVLGKNIGGVERYVEKLVELVPPLRPNDEFVVLLGPHAANRARARAHPNVEFAVLPFGDPLIQRSVLLPWAIRRHRLDILQVQRIAPWASGACRILLTIHDLIPMKHPGDYPGFRNELVRRLTRSSVSRANFITTPSQSICNDIATAYGDIVAPMRPYYNGVDPQLFAPERRALGLDSVRHLGVDRPFLFISGAVEARRNIETVVSALALLEPGRRPLLVLSGGIRDPRSLKRIKALADQLGVADRIRYLGFVSTDDLVTLYANAIACVTASSDEGFNLLPLEAMASGTPVLCSDISVHRELYEGAAAFFPCSRPDLLADAIDSILADPDAARKRHNVAAAACVARFTWNAMAERMAAIFDAMASSHMTGTLTRRSIA